MALASEWPQHFKFVDKAPPLGSLAGMGRLVAEDTRDRKHALRRLPSARTTRSWLVPKNIVLDQGGTSQCVIYAGDMLMMAHKVVNFSFDPLNWGLSEKRTKIYKAVQGMDEWAGDDYDGTSVRALFKYLQQQGLIKGYSWAFELQTALSHLKETGPLVMGTEWTDEMFSPDEHGYIYYRGTSYGGHAWIVVACNDNRKNPDGTTGAVRGQNSWGKNWGDKGRFWVPYHAFERLIKDQGEVGMPSEVKLAA